MTDATLPPAVPPADPKPSLPWWVLPSLGASVLLIYAGSIIASCFIDNDTLRTTMFTSVITLASSVVAYYYGSSAGSAKKDETLAQKPVTVQTTAEPGSATSTTTTAG